MLKIGLLFKKVTKVTTNNSGIVKIRNAEFPGY